jgi:putative aldouronate transport system permease protein
MEMETVVERATTTKKKKIKRRKDSWQLYVMLLPAFLVVAIFNYGPMGGLLMAFQDYKPYLGIMGSEWIGLDHFSFIFENPQSRQVIWNTFRFGFLKLFTGVVVALTFAILLNEVKNKFFKNTTHLIVMFPYFLSWVVIGGIIKDMLHPTSGMVNNFISSLGFDPIFFMGDNDWFVFTVIVSELWKGFGFGSIVYLAAMSSINTALYESAEIDGAGKLKQIWHITLPALKPIIAITVAISLATMLHTDFDQILNLYNPLVYEKGDIIDTYVYRIGLVQGNFGFGTAVGLFKSVIGTTLLIGAFLVMRRLNK